MPHKFGTKSEALLAQCHPALVKLVRRALEISAVDFSILEGARGRADQEAAFNRGASKVHYGNSAHNAEDPKVKGKARSCAVDVLPYPFTNWEDKNMLTAWKEIARAFAQASRELNIPERWGGDFNRDGDKTTNDAWDKPHHELYPWRDWASDKRTL